MGCVLGTTKAGTSVPYTPRQIDDQRMQAQFMPPNEVSMLTSSPSLRSASVSTSAKDKRKGKKGKEAVLSHEKHDWPKKTVIKIACRFCNDSRSLDSKDWYTVDGLKDHYEKKHHGYVNASKDKTCKHCGNKFKAISKKETHEEKCEREEWVREFEEEEEEA